MRWAILIGVAAVLGSWQAAWAADWPQFRGPEGNGIAAASDVPVEWGPNENVVWKVPMPRPGNGSPIVVGQRVFVTSAEDAGGKQRSLYCFALADGEQLWKDTVVIDKVMPTHGTNPYAGTTPASDGKHVVVWHASAGLHCYDVDGKRVWARDLGEFEHMWGYGTSPILHNDRVILFTGPGKSKVFLTSLDLKTGDTIWQTDEPFEGDGERNAERKYMGSWSTPVIVPIDGKEQIVAIMPTRVNGYDPENGEIIWSCEGVSHSRGDLAYSSPVIAGDLCYLTSGFQGAAMTLRLGGKGDITESNRLWRAERQPQSIGSGIYLDGYVYRVNAGPGTIECLDPKTGEIQWTSRGAGSNMWGSLVLAEGRMYVTNQQGTTVVFKPNPAEYEQLAANRLDEPSNATPAIVDGRIVIRTSGHLWCIGQ